ncbi:MAG: hypothetical protein J5I54_07480 [Bacteroidales bacterium]|nr:hypothetical protein [Bacteroidales bacterium]
MKCFKIRTTHSPKPLMETIEITMKKGIISRDKCPICNSTSSKIIFNRSFNEELIKEYMNVAYQGNADIEFLEDITFEIVKCSECNLL